MRRSRLTWTADVSRGAWIAPRLGPPDGRACSVVPRGYPAYARVLHPVRDHYGRPSTWTAVCEVTDRTPHALMQWQSISSPRVEDGSGRPPSRGRAWDGEQPSTGHLEPQALERLCKVLAEHTAQAARCSFAVWEGYGWVRGAPSVAVLSTSLHADPASAAPAAVAPAVDERVALSPPLRLPFRQYLLLAGPLEAATELGWWPAPNRFHAQSPNLFWPADRSWCVSTEIDLDSTLVAGSAALVDAVLTEPGLEVWPVEPGDSVGIDGDAVNV